MPERSRIGERVFRGIPVSAGICQGKIVILGKSEACIPCRTIREEDLPQEVERLESALIRTRHQLIEVQRKVGEAMGSGDASIFDAHIMVLEDRTLMDEVTRLMHQKRVNVEQAFFQIAEKYAATLDAIADDYLRERASDMRDVSSRILNNLMERPHEADLAFLRERCIIVSRDLSPSTTAMLDREKVLGFATDVGSKTSHTAIMARSLQIPATVGLHNASEQIENGTHALLDGYNGVLIIRPTDQTLFEYGQLVRKQHTLQEKLQDLREKPAITLDNLRMTLSANVEQVSDTEAVQASGAEGIGLFRTEFLYINQRTLPTEEEQFEAYSKVATALRPDPVVIRTVDLGGDKFLSHLQLPPEMNPFLGWRAIRLCLQERDMFRAQLRAILRASVAGNVKLMYPMISCLDELLQANAMLEECKRELKAENLPFNESMEVGVMIEIPSAALIADSLARRVDFFSIGTNDLIQYSMAVDRLNDRIAHLYQPTHPAMIQLIRTTVEAGRRNGIWTGVCGEMAGDPAMVPLLIGLGVDELSVAPPSVPHVKFIIRRLKATDARELAEHALECESPDEILKRCQALAGRIAPTLFDIDPSSPHEPPAA